MEEHLLMIKTQENINTYSLSNLFNILKAHKSKVKKAAAETNKINFGGPLDLVYKTISKDVCFDDEGGDNEEGLLIKTDEEVVA